MSEHRRLKRAAEAILSECWALALSGAREAALRKLFAFSLAHGERAWLCARCKLLRRARELGSGNRCPRCRTRSTRAGLFL